MTCNTAQSHTTAQREALTHINDSSRNSKSSLTTASLAKESDTTGNGLTDVYASVADQYHTQMDYVTVSWLPACM